jgi:hypothetical protein
MATSNTVTIDIDGMFATVRPGDVAPLLAAELTHPATSFRAGGPLGYRRVTGVERFYHLDADGALVVRAGLTAFVARRLRRAGVTVTVNDHRVFDSRAAPDLSALVGRPADDKAFLAAVARNPRGLIEVGRPADVVRGAALIARLFPLARVIARLATREQVRRFRRDWQAALRAPVDTFKHYDWPWGAGRLVDTYHPSCYPRSADFEVVLFADALRAAAPGYVKSFEPLACSRVYGFVRRGARMSAPKRVLAQSLFGPLIYRWPDPRGVEAAVRVRWCQPPWGRPLGDVPALERKRRAVWDNDPRNDLIAGVARALKAGDRAALWGYGLFPDGDAAASAGGRAVTILTESPRHGRELLRRLPGWRLWALAPPPGPVAEAIDDDPLRAWVLDNVILTWARADRIEAFGTEVVVRADGQPWPLDFKGFPGRWPMPGPEVLLIDVADDFDGVAREATRARQRDYAARGWPSDGLPAWLRQPV